MIVHKQNHLKSTSTRLISWNESDSWRESSWLFSKLNSVWPLVWVICAFWPGQLEKNPLISSDCDAIHRSRCSTAVEQGVLLPCFYHHSGTKTFSSWPKKETAVSVCDAFYWPKVLGSPQGRWQDHFDHYHWRSLYLLTFYWSFWRFWRLLHDPRVTCRSTSGSWLVDLEGMA